ncbi:MAG: hypothetical protein ACXV2G_07485 [Actinomycetes bacterium]
MWVAGLAGWVGAGFFMASAVGWFGWLATHYDDDPLPIRVPVICTILFVVTITLAAVLDSVLAPRVPS